MFGLNVVTSVTVIASTISPILVAKTGPAVTSMSDINPAPEVGLNTVIFSVLVVFSASAILSWMNNAFVVVLVDPSIVVPVVGTKSAVSNIKVKFNYYDFAKSISKNSKVSVFLVENKVSLIKYLKNNINPKEIVIGMGAGSISNWIRELPKYLKWLMKI